jgi:hypothetical protein
MNQAVSSRRLDLAIQSGSLKQQTLLRPLNLSARNARSAGRANVSAGNVLPHRLLG